MKRILLAATLCVLTLSGCVPFNRFFDIASDQTPVVTVVNGAVNKVTPEPLRFNNSQGELTIYWQAPSGYRFALTNGIFVNGEMMDGPEGKVESRQDQIVRCGPANAERSEFSCVNRNSRPGRYKYTVNMETVDGKPLKPFDPSIYNGGNL